MIAYIRGRLASKDSSSVVIENNGIGYEIFIPLSTLYNLPEKDEEVTLYVCPYIKDENIMLFGFSTLLEKKLFLMLTSIPGIGPRLALNILSGIGAQDLLEAILNGNTARLCMIPGIGKKIAQRIILELKEKSKGIISEDLMAKDRFYSIKSDAISALVNLGYPEKTAEKVVSEILSKKELDLETVIRESLKRLSRQV